LDHPKIPREVDFFVQKFLARGRRKPLECGGGQARDRAAQFCEGREAGAGEQGLGGGSESRIKRRCGGALERRVDYMVGGHAGVASFFFKARFLRRRRAGWMGRERPGEAGQDCGLIPVDMAPLEKRLAIAKVDDDHSAGQSKHAFRGWEQWPGSSSPIRCVVSKNF